MAASMQPELNRHLSTMYKRVRDAVREVEIVTQAERIAVLEMVKWELLRDCQQQIDEE